MPDWYLGQRLSTKGNRCTVRYVGEVNGKQGQWLGVEWDDPSRGKHSGSHEGHHYFKCRSNSPTAGSFIRPTTAWDKPRSFIAALKSKYAATMGDSDIAYDPEVEIVRISGKTAEEVGFDKIARQQAQLHNLRIVVLDDMLIKHENHDSTTSEISQTCPSITNLDLGRNLFETMSEIASICAQLDKLQSLKLDGNRLRDFTSVDGVDRESTPELEALGRLTSLELDDMLLQTNELDDMLLHFKSLKYLSASNNDLRSLDTCRFPRSLTSVVLENNNFTTLEDVAWLRSWCMGLHALSLKNNRISAASRTDTKQAPQLPTSLTDLDLSYNNITSWDIINDLPRVVPGLKHLRVSHNPLFETLQTADGKPLTSADGYMLTIARLPALETLNYSTITDKEKLNAETYYLSQIALEISLAPVQEEKAIIARHPRYHELCTEYGEPIIARRSAGTVDPNSLAARLVKCSFYFKGPLEKETLPTKTHPFVTDLPKSMSIYAVLGFVGKKFDLLPMRLKMIWETGEKERVRAAANNWAGVQEWDSSDEEGEDGGDDWQNREVEFVAGTRPLGTVLEGNEAIIRVEF